MVELGAKMSDELAGERVFTERSERLALKALGA